jgi:glycosyltransferase involved in cell wall biosynthesis
VAIKNSHNPHLEVIEEAEKKNIPSLFVECRRRFDITAIKKLIAVIKQYKINIIHTHNYKANFLGCIAAKMAKVPIVATNHLWTHSNLKLRFYEFIDSFILRYFINQVVAVSDSIKEDMLKRGIPSSKIKVIFNGIDVSNNGPSRKVATLPRDRQSMFHNQQPTENRLQEEKHNSLNTIRSPLSANRYSIIIGVVGRLSIEKGHRYLLEAFAKIVKKNHDVKLLIVGKGLQRERLADSVQRLGLEEKVMFAGYQKDIDKVYREIDILVQPSLREGLPLTILEAMSYGLPIIATNVGGVAGLIKNKKTGILINSGSSDEIYNALMVLIKDVDLRKKLGENGRKFVRENYSLEKMIGEYRGVYEEVDALTR